MSAAHNTATGRERREPRSIARLLEELDLRIVEHRMTLADAARQGTLSEAQTAKRMGYFEALKDIRDWLTGRAE